MVGRSGSANLGDAARGERRPRHRGRGRHRKVHLRGVREAGAAVVVASPGDNGAETADLIDRGGGRGLFVRTDVSVAEQVEAAIQTAVERFGGLDAVVHNATSRRSSEVVPLDAIDDQAWDDHVAVSLRGAYHCAASLCLSCRSDEDGFFS